MSATSPDSPLKRHSSTAKPKPADGLIEVRPDNQPKSALRDTRKNVEINIGKACNNRCVFCIDGLPKREDRSYMAWPLMQAELRQWADEGYRSVGFLGGEPTTYPKICESVRLARELGFTRIAIATNATKLRLPHFADRILDADPELAAHPVLAAHVRAVEEAQVADYVERS